VGREGETGREWCLCVVAELWGDSFMFGINGKKKCLKLQSADGVHDMLHPPC
jgi:hypothetical protein